MFPLPCRPLACVALLGISLASAISAAETPATPGAAQASPGAASRETGNEEINPAAADEAAKTANAPPKRTAAPTDTLFFSWLEQQKLPGSSLWLGKDEPKFFALFAQESLGQPKGAVLLLPDQGQFAGWPGYLLDLHRQLPRAGWHSLFVTLPNPAAPTPPERATTAPAAPTESPGTAGETSNDTVAPAPSDQKMEESPAATPEEKTPKAPEESAPGAVTAGMPPEASSAGKAETSPAPTTVSAQVNQRIQAAIDYLNQEGQFNLALVGAGIGAPRAVLFLSEFPPSTDPEKVSGPQGLILLNAHNGEPGGRADLLKQLPDLKLPILDLVEGYQPALLKDAKARLDVMPRLKQPHYQQVLLPPSPNQADAGNPDRVAKRIRGWLDRHMAGKQITAVRTP